MSLKRNAESSEPSIIHTKRVKYDTSDDCEKNEAILANEKSFKDNPKTLPPLLTLSDEILLFILRFLDPIDVINLGRSCVRMSGVVRDRALWSKVDLRAAPLMLCQLQVFVPYLHASTKALLTRGPAPLPPSGRRVVVPLHHHHHHHYHHHHHHHHHHHQQKLQHRRGSSNNSSVCGDTVGGGSGEPGGGIGDVATAVTTKATTAAPVATATASTWEPRRCSPAPMLRALADTCPNLETLHVERHVYDARQVFVTDFPSSVKKLVLEGCEFYYVSREKSYFHGINKHLINLQELVLDGCLWLSADCLMAISKCAQLRKLGLRYCRNVGACYAYISLSARFGFKALEELDVRGSALGDHEISCFQSISSLTHLYIEAPQTWPPVKYSYHSPSCTNGVHPMFACARNGNQQGEKDNPEKSDGVAPKDENSCPKAARCMCLGAQTPRRPKEKPYLVEKAPPSATAAAAAAAAAYSATTAVQCVVSGLMPSYDCRFDDEHDARSDDEDEDDEDGGGRGGRGGGGMRDPREEELAAQLRGGSDLVSDEALLSLGTRFVLELQNALPRPPPPPARPLVRNPRLRHLCVTNCARVTDLTLAHLTLHQPLRFVDIRGCSVTARGVADFQGLRPDVELIHDHCLPDRDPADPIPAPPPVIVFPAPAPEDFDRNDEHEGGGGEDQ